MAKKKLTGVIGLLTALCMLVLSMPVTAFEAGTANVTLERKTVTVTGSSQASTPVSCIILAPGYTEYSQVTMDDYAQAFFYTNQQRADQDGAYTFSFEMLDTNESGTYTVFLDGDKAGEFFYASITDREEIIAQINAASSAEAVGDILKNESIQNVLEVMGLRVDRYLLLGDECATVDALVYRNGADYTGAQAEQELADVFNDAYVIAFLNQSETSSELKTRIEENNDILALDLEGENSLYKTFTDSEKDVVFKAMQQRLPFESLAEVQQAFAEDTCIPVLNAMAFGAFEDVVEQYNEYLQFNMADYNALSGDAKTELAKSLVESAPFETMDEIRSTYSRLLADAQANDDDDDDSRNNGGGGGGGRYNSNSGNGSTVYIDPEYTQNPPDVNDTYQPPVVEPEDDEFLDLSEAAWAKDSITALAEQGIVSGDGDGNFRPNDNIKREEFLKMALEAFDLVQDGASCSFADVSESDWYYPYVASAFAQELITGVDEENFGAGAAITRQDMAVMAFRIAAAAGISLEASGEDTVFIDDDQIGDYAKDAVGAMTRAGIINGLGDETFAPQANATRAQACKIIYQLLNLA